MVSINCELQGPWRTQRGCSTPSPPARSPAGSRRRPREEVRGAVAWAGGSAGWSPCGGCCWGPPAWTRGDSSTGRSRDTRWISPLVRRTTCILFYVYRFVIYNLQVQILVTMERRTCLTGKVEAVERCRSKNHIFCCLSSFQIHFLSFRTSSQFNISCDSFDLDSISQVRLGIIARVTFSAF